MLFAADFGKDPFVGVLGLGRGPALHPPVGEADHGAELLEAAGQASMNADYPAWKALAEQLKSRHRVVVNRPLVRALDAQLPGVLVGRALRAYEKTTQTLLRAFAEDRDGHLAGPMTDAERALMLAPLTTDFSPEKLVKAVRITDTHWVARNAKDAADELLYLPFRARIAELLAGRIAQSPDPVTTLIRWDMGGGVRFEDFCDAAHARGYDRDEIAAAVGELDWRAHFQTACVSKSKPRGWDLDAGRAVDASGYLYRASSHAGRELLSRFPKR